MNVITSLQNEAIKNITKLKKPSERKKQKRFVVEGMRALNTFIENGYNPLEIYSTKDHIYKNAIIVSEIVMKKMSNASTPSGILAVFALPENPSTSKLSAGLVLANITDPGNMGTLIRSCAAFGFSTVVVVEGCDPFSPKVIQATAGTLPLVNIFQWSWEEVIRNKGDLILHALTVENGIPLKNINYQKSLFVVGNEAHGIKQEWIDSCDKKITLSMSKNVESLNAAVAGSLVLAYKHFTGY